LRQVRYLARSFAIPGDHAGQSSTGVRMPFGGVGVITPFNFPLEIPALQTCSALFMGNQPLAKVDWKVAIVMEQVVNARFFHTRTAHTLAHRRRLLCDSSFGCCTTSACPRPTSTTSTATAP